MSALLTVAIRLRGGELPTADEFAALVYAGSADAGVAAWLVRRYRTEVEPSASAELMQALKAFALPQ